MFSVILCMSLYFVRVSLFICSSRRYSSVVLSNSLTDQH